MKNIMRKAGKGLAILLAGAVLTGSGYFAGKNDGIQLGREQGRKAAMYAVEKEFIWLGKENSCLTGRQTSPEDKAYWTTRGEVFELAGKLAPSRWHDALRYHLNHEGYQFKGIVDSLGRVDTNKAYQVFSAEYDKKHSE